VTRVGLISDTHGLLRPQAVAALQGCDFIVHGGDIGSPAILEALRAIAPLTVVRQADSASAILTQLTNTRAANLRATISKYLAGGDASVTADTLPMFELKIDEAQITAQYFITAPGDVMLYEILVFSYRKIEIRTAPQQGTGSRGATRECQIIVASMS